MFDRYVSNQTKPSWDRRARIIASLALHVLLAGGLVGWSFLHIEEIAPPALSLTFFSAAPPPPPPPPPPKSSSATHVEKKIPKITPTQVVQPTDVKPIVQPKKEDEKPDEDDGEEGGEEGGVKGGVAGGVKGGVIGGVVGGVVGGAGTGSGPVAAPKMVASITLMAQQLSHPLPHLPEWFSNQHAHQNVRGVYKVCLRTDGHISDVYPMTSIPGVDQQVIEQIKAGWVYKPQPVAICTASVVIFQIN